MSCDGAAKAVLEYPPADVAQVTFLQLLLRRVEAAISAARVAAAGIGPTGSDPGVQPPQLHPSSPCGPQVGARCCTVHCVLRCMHMSLQWQPRQTRSYFVVPCVSTCDAGLLLCF